MWLFGVLVYAVAIPITFVAINIGTLVMWLFGILVYAVAIPTTFVAINIGTLVMWLFGILVYVVAIPITFVAINIATVVMWLFGILVYIVAIPITFVAINIGTLVMWLFGILIYVCIIPLTFIVINIGTVLMWLFGTIVYGTIAIVGVALLFVGAIGGLVTALFYVLFFALIAGAGAAVLGPFLSIGMFSVGKVAWVQDRANDLQQMLRAKTLSEVQDALRTRYEKNNNETLKISVAQLQEQIKINMFWACFFIFCSTADIISDSIYAYVTDFINPTMKGATVIFLLLPMAVLFVQHQVRMGEAWLKTRDGEELALVRRVLGSDWRVPLMPVVMLGSVATFWIVLSYRFTVMMGRAFMRVEHSWLVYLYGQYAGNNFMRLTCQKKLPEEEEEEEFLGFSDESVVTHGHILSWGNLILDKGVTAPMKSIANVCSSKDDSAPEVLGDLPVVVAPPLLFFGGIVLCIYCLGALVLSLFFVLTSIFIWPTLWVIASAIASCFSAVWPAALSALYALSMHLKLFAVPASAGWINRLEAMTLWTVAMCTKSYRVDGASGRGSQKDRDWQYANALLGQVLSFKKMRSFNADNPLYNQNTLKSRQWETTAQLFSYGSIEFKLTENDWAKSGFLGVVFLNEMLLESWVQILLQVINNEYYEGANNGEGGWTLIAIGSIIFSLLVILGNAAQFVWKFQQNRDFGLAGAFLKKITDEKLKEFSQIRSMKSSFTPFIPTTQQIRTANSTAESSAIDGWDESENNVHTAIFRMDSTEGSTGVDGGLEPAMYGQVDWPEENFADFKAPVDQPTDAGDDASRLSCRDLPSPTQGFDVVHRFSRPSDNTLSSSSVQGIDDDSSSDLDGHQQLFQQFAAVDTNDLNEFEPDEFERFMLDADDDEEFGQLGDFLDAIEDDGPTGFDEDADAYVEKMVADDSATFQMDGTKGVGAEVDVDGGLFDAFERGFDEDSDEGASAPQRMNTMRMDNAEDTNQDHDFGFGDGFDSSDEDVIQLYDSVEDEFGPIQRMDTMRLDSTEDTSAELEDDFDDEFDTPTDFTGDGFPDEYVETRAGPYTLTEEDATDFDL